MEEDDEIERVIKSLPKLRSSRRLITSDEAEALIADDDDLFDAVALYTAQNPNIFMEWVEQREALIALLKRVKPFRPGYFGKLYRGQGGNCEQPGPMGFRSWSLARDIAEYFARDYRPFDVVCEMSRPVKAVSISGICMWRMRVRDESQYCGMQAEYLVLDSSNAG